MLASRLRAVPGAQASCSTMLSLPFCGRAVMLECRLQQGVLLENQASAQEEALPPLAWLQIIIAVSRHSRDDTAA